MRCRDSALPILIREAKKFSRVSLSGVDRLAFPAPINGRDCETGLLSPTTTPCGSAVASARARFLMAMARSDGVKHKSQRDGVDGHLEKWAGIPAASDQSGLSHAFLALKMKHITSLSTFIILLLQCATLPCVARSGRRSSPPATENDPLRIFNGLNSSLVAGPADPHLKILSRVPYDEKIGGLTLRITALKRGPFISSFNILPCMIDMLSTAFDAIWNEADQHPKLHDRFMCSENGLTLTVLSKQPPLKSMEYSDLVMLGKMLLNFQQEYRLPGIAFGYLEDGQMTGTGEISWNRAESQA